MNRLIAFFKKNKRGILLSLLLATNFTLFYCLIEGDTDEPHQFLHLVDHAEAPTSSVDTGKTYREKLRKIFGFTEKKEEKKKLERIYDATRVKNREEEQTKSFNRLFRDAETVKSMGGKGWVDADKDLGSRACKLNTVFDPHFPPNQDKEIVTFFEGVNARNIPAHISKFQETEQAYTQRLGGVFTTLDLVLFLLPAKIQLFLQVLSENFNAVYSIKDAINKWTRPFDTLWYGVPKLILMAFAISFEPLDNIFRPFSEIGTMKTEVTYLVKAGLKLLSPATYKKSWHMAPEDINNTLPEAGYLERLARIIINPFVLSCICITAIDYTLPDDLTKDLRNYLPDFISNNSPNLRKRYTSLILFLAIIAKTLHNRKTLSRELASNAGTNPSLIKQINSFFYREFMRSTLVAKDGGKCFDDVHCKSILAGLTIFKTVVGAYNRWEYPAKFSVDRVQMATIYANMKLLAESQSSKQTPEIQAIRNFINKPSDMRQHLASLRSYNNVIIRFLRTLYETIVGSYDATTYIRYMHEEEDKHGTQAWKEALWSYYRLMPFKCHQGKTGYTGVQWDKGGRTGSSSRTKRPYFLLEEVSHSPKKENKEVLKHNIDIGHQYGVNIFISDKETMQEHQQAFTYSFWDALHYGGVRAQSAKMNAPDAIFYIEGIEEPSITHEKLNTAYQYAKDNPDKAVLVVLASLFLGSDHGAYSTYAYCHKFGTLSNTTSLVYTPYREIHDLGREDNFGFYHASYKKDGTPTGLMAKGKGTPPLPSMAVNMHADVKKVFLESAMRDHASLHGIKLKKTRSNDYTKSLLIFFVFLITLLILLLFFSRRRIV